MRILQFLVILFPLISGAQSITGRVVFQGEGLPGATVQLIPGSYGAVALPDGSFEIKDVPEGHYALEVRSVGFKTKRLRISIPYGSLLLIALEESALTMNEVVVTGTMQPTFVSQSPVKVEVVTSKHINTYIPAASSSIVEGISLVNGVQEVVSCGVCFTNSLSINGLPGPYTAILMDGAPIYGNLASVYGLNGIPTTIIDRFEVIKGPSSTLYGSEAVAGVINIITKNPEDQPIFSVDMMGTSHRETFGNLSGSIKAGRTKGSIGLNYGYVNHFDDQNEDGFSDLVNFDRISMFSKWDFFRASGKKFTIAGKYLFEDRRNGVKSYLMNRNYRQLRGSDQIYGESIYTKRLEVFGTYELPVSESLRLDYSLSTHNQDSYYGADYYLARQDILFGNLIWDKDWGAHLTTIGFTSRYQSYDDNTIATATQTANQPDRQFIPGIFIQDEWAISDKWTALAGSRIDHYDAHGVIISPRLNLKYKPGNWTTLRSNFGTGFRIVNLFTEDHAFVTGQRQVILEESLMPEESYNLSLNLNHIYNIGSSQGMVDLDLFYTYFTNKITPDYSIEGEIRYANVDGYAVSRGIGITLQQEMEIPLSFNLGFNLQQVEERENGNRRSIEFAPRWTGVMTGNYRMKKWRTTIAYSAQLTGAMQLPTVFDLDKNGIPIENSRPTTSKPFALHNLQFSRDLERGFSIYGGVQNILNFMQPWSPITGINDPTAHVGFSDRFDTAYSYAPIHGREWYLGIRWMTGK